MPLVLSPRWAWSAVTGLQENVHVVIGDGRILDVVRECPTMDADRIALPEGLLIPGLINLHNHALSAPLFRGLADDLGPDDLPGHVVFSLLMPLGDAAAQLMTPDEIGDVAEMALLEGLRGGTTTVLDVWRPAQAAFVGRARRLGLRSYGCPYLFTTPKLGMDLDGTPVWGGADAGPAMLDAATRLFEAEDDGPAGRTRIGLGPHGPDSCAPELLRAVEARARALDAVVSIHCAQNLHEVAFVRERYRCTPVEHLRSLGLLRPGVVLAHMMYATDGDLALVREHGAAVATCPLAFARSGRGVPIARFLDSGVRLGIGTDGVTLDMVAELRAAAVLAKVQSGQAGAGGAERLLTAATADSAAALGRTDLGALTPGAVADLLLFDLSGGRYQPVWNPLRALLTNGSAADLHTALVDGFALLRNGRVIVADESAVIRRGRAAIERVWREAVREGRLPPALAARAPAELRREM